MLYYVSTALYLCVCHSSLFCFDPAGRGFKLAPVYGKLLAELALGRKTSYSLAPFRISRFPNSCAKSKL